MTLQLLHSEFPYIWGKFDFLFYQCNLTAGPACASSAANTHTRIWRVITSYVAFYPGRKQCERAGQFSGPSESLKLCTKLLLICTVNGVDRKLQILCYAEGMELCKGSLITHNWLSKVGRDALIFLTCALSLKLENQHTLLMSSTYMDGVKKAFVKLTPFLFSNSFFILCVTSRGCFIS